MLTWLGELTSKALEAVSYGNMGALAALFSMATLTEVGVPFPFMLDSILAILGSQIGQLWLQALYVMLALLLGREAGSAIVYWLAHSLGRRLLTWLGKRFPSLRRNLGRFASKFTTPVPLEATVSRLGGRAPLGIFAAMTGGRVPLSVAIARLTPGLLTSASFASGVIGLRYRYFVLGVALASIFADGSVVTLGITMEYGLKYLGFTPPPWLIVTVFVTLICLAWVVRRLLAQRKSHRGV